jgi:hypothetical protein
MLEHNQRDSATFGSTPAQADDAPTASVQVAADDVGQVYGLWIRRTTPPAAALGRAETEELAPW